MNAGNPKPDVSSKSRFDDDKYMVPALEDDALLYNLDDISGEDLPVFEEDGNRNESSQTADPTSRIRDLEQELNRLRGEFVEYKEIVKRSLDKEIVNEDEGESSATLSVRQAPESRSSRGLNQAEEGYFSSYSFNGRLTSIGSEQACEY